MSKKLTDAELHSAGATVRHQSPFSDLESYKNTKPITQEFRNKWVIPFYFELGNTSDDWIKQMIALKPNISKKIILQNLGDFDWRTRSTGSYFAAIKNETHLEDIIGTHLLKSEVCYAGKKYAITLASFNGKKSSHFFKQYLDYYLRKPELYFDQEFIMSAQKYLDEINGTQNIKTHLKDWETFMSWRDNNTRRQLEEAIQIVPEKTNDLEESIANLKPRDRSIEMEYLADVIACINKIKKE